VLLTESDSTPRGRLVGAMEVVGDSVRSPVLFSPEKLVGGSVVEVGLAVLSGAMDGFSTASGSDDAWDGSPVASPPGGVCR
jgi:hypothetical protein